MATRSRTRRQPQSRDEQTVVEAQGTSDIYEVPTTSSGQIQSGPAEPKDGTEAPPPKRQRGRPKKDPDASLKTRGGKTRPKKQERPMPSINASSTTKRKSSRSKEKDTAASVHDSDDSNVEEEDDEPADAEEADYDPAEEGDANHSTMKADDVDHATAFLRAIRLEGQWNAIRKESSGETKHKPKTEKFKKIARHISDLQGYVENLYDSWESKVEYTATPLIPLCKSMEVMTRAFVKQQVGTDMFALSTDFYSFAVPAVLDTLDAVFTLLDGSLRDQSEIHTLWIVERLCHHLTVVLDSFSACGKLPAGGDAQKRATIVRRIIKPRIGTMAERLANALQSREHRLSRDRAPEHEQRAHHGHPRPAQPEPVGSSQESTGSQSPPHDTSLVQARMETKRTMGQWTDEMDDELLQGLSTSADKPLIQRYNSCLARPLLQNLMTEHIQTRALHLRPTFIAWYEEKGEAVPHWVTSIGSF